MIRPEVRNDHSLNGTHPFNDSFDQHMLAAAMNIILILTSASSIRTFPDCGNSNVAIRRIAARGVTAVFYL